MKPKNFPTRKNQRRIEALERQKKYNGEFPSKSGLAQVEKLEAILDLPVKGRSKKDRSSRAALRRI